ncbi:MAG TPA: class I SAM-dependent methyltransferase [Pyrinomonadaceae bacterium]|nr:class I SAM-dependent methyltransferase [Pyrinomonadaceae bacterium]
MKAINSYYVRQLTAAEIAAGEHRNFVGGLWQEIGDLQFEFLMRNGLAAHHTLIDVGCGALRCGIPIIRYLDCGNYFGLDINSSLIEAARSELANEGLTNKHPQLLVNEKFDFARFGVHFDFAIAQSIFTHLDAQLISQCLGELHKVLKPDGKFFATFFRAPSSGHTGPIRHEPDGVVTNFDADPFHFSFSELEQLATITGFSARLIGDWNHPRGQQMLELSPLSSPR